MRIRAYSIEIEWEDGTKERLVDIPLYVSRVVNQHLDEIEEQVEH